jgi:hypothetical protein
VRVVQRHGGVAVKAEGMMDMAGAELKGGSKVGEMVTGHMIGGGPSRQWCSDQVVS